MDLRKLKTLIDLVETSGIAELEIQEGEERVRITRAVAPGPAAYLPAADADPAVSVERAEWDDDVTDKVAAAMSQLDARSQAILRARWMDEPKATLHELAEQYGVSAERIRQIEANAIKKLRKLVVAD